MNKKAKRELLEWSLLILTVGAIYLGGWHTQVIGKLQRAVLSTGIITPQKVEVVKKASYDFVLKDLNGNAVPFKSFHDKVVFMNFWATWCAPCIAEMPDINHLYRKTSDSVSFVMISFDKEEQKAIDFAKEQGFDFPIYFLYSKLPEVYSIGSIPSTYLLSKNGEIIIENQGMAKYNSKSFRALLSDLLKTQ